MTFHLLESIEGLPNFWAAEQQIESAVCSSRGKSLFLAQNRVDFGRRRSAFANALHMHQPLIPPGGSHLTTADIISNLKYMMDNPGIGDNHNAPVFHWCYKRIGEFVPQLVDEGKQPRIILEYSGSITSPPYSDSTRSPACAAFHRRKWRCQTIRTLRMSS